MVWCFLFTWPVCSLCHTGQGISACLWILSLPKKSFNTLWIATHLPLLHQHHYRCCFKLYNSSSSGCNTTGASSPTFGAPFSIEIRFSREEQVIPKENEITAWIPGLNEWIYTQLKQFSTARPFLDVDSLASMIQEPTLPSLSGVLGGLVSSAQLSFLFHESYES